MTKHVKLAVSVLFIALMILTAAITRFYSDTEKTSSDSTETADIVRKLPPDTDGSRIFVSKNGLYGVTDRSGRITILPEWRSLRRTKSGLYVASEKIADTVLTGCIDSEGSVTVPFIYSSITDHSYDDLNFYIAKAAADGTCVVYDDEFRPCFNRSWISAESDDSELILTSDVGEYSYSLSSEGFIFKSASVAGSVMNCELRVSITSGGLLSKLDPAMIEKLISQTQLYLNYAYTNELSYVGSLDRADGAEISGLFTGEKNITSKKLTEISNIYIYSTSYEGDIPLFTVSVTAGSELGYNGADGRSGIITGKYTATLEFKGDNAESLELTSAGFRESAPDYPKAEPEQEPVPDNAVPEGDNGVQEDSPA